MEFKTQLESIKDVNREAYKKLYNSTFFVLSKKVGIIFLL